MGVITPYREQRKLLRETFEEVCGKGPASEVGAAVQESIPARFCYACKGAAPISRVP